MRFGGPQFCVYAFIVIFIQSCWWWLVWRGSFKMEPQLHKHVSCWIFQAYFYYVLHPVMNILVQQHFSTFAQHVTFGPLYNKRFYWMYKWVNLFNIVACRVVTGYRPRNKQAPMATSSHAAIEELLETAFSTRSVPRCNRNKFRS
jgi:hypothetical protein